MRKWICGKWKENAAGVKCAVFLLLMMELCLFWSCGRAYAAQERQDGNARNLVITRQLDEEELDTAADPPASWMDEQGTEYRLKDWNVTEIPGKRVSRHVTRRMRYDGVEGAERIPESITVREEETGEMAQGLLMMKEMQVLSERWDDSFSVPVTFHAYGAREYELGGLVIDAAEAERADLWGEALLRTLGLLPEAYRLSALEWAGEEYVDETGQICRQATVSGERLLRDYEAVYEGEVLWQEPSVYELRTEYEPVEETSVFLEPSEERVKETAASQEAENGPLWYWVRSGFVLTVAAGLLGIAAGAAVLLICWLRQRKRERQEERLPMIEE